MMLRRLVMVALAAGDGVIDPAVATFIAGTGKERAAEAAQGAGRCTDAGAAARLFLVG
jgi:hypothetical protein